MLKLLKAEKFIFYLLVFCLPLQTRHIFYQWGQYFNEWNLVYLYATDILILTLIFFWFLRGFKIRFKKTEAALLVFLILSGLSLIGAKNFWLGVYSWAKLTEFAVLFLYAKYNFAALYDLGRFFKVFVAGAILQSVAAIGQFVKQGSLGLKFLTESPLAPDIAGVAKIELGGQKIIRAYGLMPHPNVLAVILLAAIFFALYLFIEKNKNFQWPGAVAYAAVLSVLTFAFFLTFSRTIIIIGLAAIFCWLFYLLIKDGRKWYILNTLVIFAAIGVFTVIALWPFLPARFDVASGLADQSFSLRVFYNEVALQFIGQHPILGVGVGNFVWTFQGSRALAEAWMFQPAHNIYLLVAAETGILGLLAFLIFLFFVIWRSIRNLSFFCFLFLVSCFLIIGLFDHFFWTLQPGQLMLWIMLGISASVNKSPRSLTDKASPSEGEDCAFNSHRGH